MTPVTTPRDAGLCFHTAGHRQPPGLPGWVGPADFRVLITRGGKPATLPKIQAQDRGGRKRERKKIPELRGKDPGGERPASLLPARSPSSSCLRSSLRATSWNVDGGWPRQGGTGPAAGQTQGGGLAGEAGGRPL